MCDHSTGTTQPPYWHKPVYKLDPLEPDDNGFINDDLIIWMREAAFPNFKKLYGVLYRADNLFIDGLPEGRYTIDISYSILPPVLKILRECLCGCKKLPLQESETYLTCVPLCPFVSIALASILRPLSFSLWSPIFSLDLCPSRFPCAVLPRQKGSGADHTDLVRRSEPFPSHCLPSNQQPAPTDSRHPHHGLVEVWKGWTEYGGVKGEEVVLRSERVEKLKSSWKLCSLGEMTRTLNEDVSKCSI